MAARCQCALWESESRGDAHAPEINALPDLLQQISSRRKGSFNRRANALTEGACA